ncbi:MAG: phage tail tip lysozyme [Oscillospiraceae bacterium]
MNEKTIWNKLISAGLTFAGTAGLMGNLYAESALNPQNLQNSYEKKLGYTDSIYTQAVKKSMRLYMKYNHLIQMYQD